MISGKMKIENIDCNEKQRIIAISDIHGEVTYLDGVLKKVQYTEQDILVIVGDVIEKGRESLKTVRYILKLTENNPNVHVSMGNVDLYRLSLFFDDSKEGNEKFIGGLRWTRDVWKRGLFLDILDEMGIDLEELCEENIAGIKEQVKKKYQKELEFLWNLPTVIAMGNFIFVHGGVYSDKLEELTETEPFVYLKLDDFMNKDVKFEKTVVVGHWPTCIYRDDILSMNPLFNFDKHIIAIDGGCALKKDGGQLNALVIPHKYAEISDVGYVAYDDYPVMIARKAQQERKSNISIRYTNSEVKLLTENNGIASVEHISTGKVFDVPSSFLYQNGDRLCCTDYNDTYLEITEGDKLSVLAENKQGMLVKKNGVIGWYLL